MLTIQGNKGPFTKEFESMAQEFPSFLKLFSAYRPQRDVLVQVVNWRVEKAVVDKATRIIRI